MVDKYIGLYHFPRDQGTSGCFCPCSVLLWLWCLLFVLGTSKFPISKCEKTTGTPSGSWTSHSESKRFFFALTLTLSMATPHVNNSSCGGKMSILQERLIRKHLKSVLQVEPAALNSTK